MAMHHMVCDRLVCRGPFMSGVVEMGVCDLEVAGLDRSYFLSAGCEGRFYMLG